VRLPLHARALRRDECRQTERHKRNPSCFHFAFPLGAPSASLPVAATERLVGKRNVIVSVPVSGASVDKGGAS
jgi:hypothetical protein